MGDFGAYEQVEQLDLAGHVWTARKGPGAPPQFVIRLAPGPKVEPNGGPKVTALRTAAELQKKMSDAKTPGWAPIYQVGQTPAGGAYYVTAHYPWSLQLLVEQKDEITSDHLAKMTDALAAGVAALGTKYGRGHGNLKLNNVFLTERDPRRAKIFISDPAPPQSPAALDPLADRHGMGKVIFELVTKLKYQDYNWPVRGHKSWEALGPNGTKWLDWCNRLLDPKAGDKSCTLEQFRQEVKDLVPKPPVAGNLKMPIAVAAGVILVGGIGFFVMHSRAPIAAAPPVQAPPPVQIQTPQPQPPTPTPVPVAAPAPTPAPTPPPPPVAPVNHPQLTADQQQAMDAARAAAQNDLDAQVSSFGDLAFEVQTNAPDIYDVEGDVQKARNIALPQSANAQDVAAQEKISLQNIRTLRQQSAAAALGNARKVTFKNPAINQGFGNWLKTAITDPNPEKSLQKAVHMIHALRQLDTAWPADLAGPANIAAIYNARRDAAVNDAIAALAQNPNAGGEKSALDQFQATMAALNNAATATGLRIQAVTAANAMLASANRPDPAGWQTMKDQLARLPRPAAGWPDAPADQALGQVNGVLGALQTTDANQLEKYAAAPGSPAMVAAVGARFPALHGDADLDSKIFLDLKKSLGQVPAAVSASVNDLWLGRMKAETDAGRAYHLAELAGAMGLPTAPQRLAVVYFNARAAVLRQQFNGKAEPVKTFLNQTEPLASGSWPMDSAAKSAVTKTLADLRLALNPPPPGKLPPGFAKVSQDSPDYVYTPPFDPEHSMRFNRVVNKSTGQPFYLCTTEASAGWFMGLVNDRHKGVAFRKLMDFTIPGKLAGPAVWRVNFIRGEIELNRDRSWLAYSNHNWDDDPSKYTPARGPTFQSPMQYVSPLAAMDAARLVGCRLPTAQEWQSAYESAPRDSDENTSGGNWQRFRAAIDDLHPTPTNSGTWTKFKQELGIEDDRGEKLPYAGPVRSENADILWFRDVPDNAATFHDLAGNVAEWVLSGGDEGPAPYLENDEPIVVVDEAGRHVVTNQQDASLAAFHRHCLRVGLSTISSKADDPAHAVIPADPRGIHHHQYFDMGFRLAMNDPNAPTAPALASVVNGLQPVAISATP